MAQPAGKLFGHHDHDQASALRASLIIYASDAIHFLACMVWHSFSIGSPRDALRLVVETRYRDANREG